jgi:SAM-dependent methyltransferase
LTRKRYARHKQFFLLAEHIDKFKYVNWKGESEMNKNTLDEEIKSAVRDTYGELARRFAEQPVPGTVDKAVTTGCCGPVEGVVSTAAKRSCCGPSESAVTTSGRRTCCGPAEAGAGVTGAARFYTSEELGELPQTVTDASLGCGNPLAIAELRPGEVVLDLGSGGGIDCFLAAQRVGPEGRVIGLDMTPDMIRLARRNARELGATNVDFRFGEMEDIPLPAESVDAIISNCVINLSPDKDAVFREAYRVLRPGGRLSVSDIVVDGELPKVIRENLSAWAGCLAGALDESDYLARIRQAGFGEVTVLSRDYADIEESAEWDEVQAMVVREDNGVVEGRETQELLEGMGLSPHELARKVASIKVRAVKPA